MLSLTRNLTGLSLVALIGAAAALGFTGNKTAHYLLAGSLAATAALGSAYGLAGYREACR